MRRNDKKVEKVNNFPEPLPQDNLDFFEFWKNWKFVDPPLSDLIWEFFKIIITNPPLIRLLHFIINLYVQTFCVKSAQTSVREGATNPFWSSKVFTSIKTLGGGDWSSGQYPKSRSFFYSIPRNLRYWHFPSYPFYVFTFYMYLDILSIIALWLFWWETKIIIFMDGGCPPPICKKFHKNYYPFQPFPYFYCKVSCFLTEKKKEDLQYQIHIIFKLLPHSALSWILS